MSNTDYGLLVDYKYCSGCHACEVACKQEHNFPVGKWRIKVYEKGPWKIDDAKDEWDWDNVPIPTALCDLCADRTAEGKKPTCVKHCLSFCMGYGPIDELAKKMAEKGNKVALFKPL